jgi:peptidoglycan-associated lipoprotein
MKKLTSLAALVVLFILGGCTSTNDKPETLGAPIIEGGNTGNIPIVNTDRPTGADLPTSLTSGELAKRSVFFALDRYDVAEEYRNLLTAHARFLVANPGFKILIQGNTDERGSHEYNLSLGQKRAEAVGQTLILLGVPGDRIESVSLGEEKPLVEGHDETAWSQNRRADILYSGEF